MSSAWGSLLFPTRPTDRPYLSAEYRAYSQAEIWDRQEEDAVQSDPWYKTLPERPVSGPFCTTSDRREWTSMGGSWWRGVSPDRWTGTTQRYWKTEGENHG